MNLTSLKGVLFVCFLALTFHTMRRTGYEESGVLLAYFAVQVPNVFDWKEWHVLGWSCKVYRQKLGKRMGLMSLLRIHPSPKAFLGV